MSPSASPYAQPADWNDDAGGAPRLTRAVLTLLALNVGVYFVQATVQGNLPEYLGFEGTRRVLDGRLWTPLTYMFVHGGLLHLAFNMFSLWMFGPRLERAWGTRAFTWFYLWCGLGGAAAHALFVRDGAGLVGASGAIFGLLLAFALRWPEEEVLFFGLVPMKMKWYAIFLGAITLASGAADAATGGGPAGGTSHLAHLGGLAFGALWLLRPAVPDVEHLRRRVSPAPDVDDGLSRPVPPRSTPRPRPERSAADEAVERSRALTGAAAAECGAAHRRTSLGAAARERAAGPPRENPQGGRPRPARAAERGAGVPPVAPSPAAVAAASAAASVAARRETLDRLLDKISAGGMASLSGEERRLLEETSRSLRDQ
jgi:membrane associated rhomboid family serine protease